MAHAILEEVAAVISVVRAVGPRVVNTEGTVCAVKVADWRVAILLDM